MSQPKAIRAGALSVVFLSFMPPALARGYEAVRTRTPLSLAGDFSALKGCRVDGKLKGARLDDASALLAESDATLCFEPPIPLPYSATAWVRLPAKSGKLTLAACRAEKGGYQVELSHSNQTIGIRALANGVNLWGPATYRFREGGGTDALHYRLRLDSKDLAKRLERIENGLKGRTLEWKEWGLGVKGEFFEERQAQGIREVIQANEAQPLAAERWTQVSVDVAADLVRMWVDGRLVGEVKDPPSTSGPLVLHLPAGAALRSLEVESLREPLAGFVPLDLGGYHNQSLKGAALPSGLVRVRGIPFLLRRTPNGRDALDVGVSAPLETGFASGSLGSEFEGASGLLRHPSRIVLQVPKGWYSHLYLLAFAEKRPETEPVVSFRFFRGEHTGTVVDYSAQVPFGDERGRGEGFRISDFRFPIADSERGPAGPQASAFGNRQSAIGNGPRPRADAPQGQAKDLWLHVVRIPLEPCLLQSSLEKSFCRDFQIEVTRGLHFTRGYPDPYNYTSLAGGKRSSVRILGLTFEESPLQMVVTADEAGNLVVEPDRPFLNVVVRNPSARAQSASLCVSAVDTHAGAKAEIKETLEIPERTSVAKRVLLPLTRYGFYRVEVTLRSRAATLVKRTTLGYLPPDTRKAGWGDSAFGIWCWGAGVGGYSYPANSEETMRLVWKLGGRWALGIADPPIARHYRITNAWSGLPGLDWDKVPREKWEGELKTRMAAELKKSRESFPDQDLYLMFGEPNLGLKQTFALPGHYCGEPDYELNEAEKKRFDRMFEIASVSGKALAEAKKEHPEFRNVRIAFGNTSPNFHIAFLQRGLPKECVGSFGIDIPYFERMPERQPRAVEASQMLYLYDFRKEAKCEDLPIYGTEDMYYPGCPGSLSQREQADYTVRCHLLKFALGVTREAAVGMIFSTSGPYGRCHYGGAGFFEVAPEGGGDGNPREAAVAYATLTRVLDGAKFEKHFSTGSFSAFCLAFSRKFGQGDVLALWTLHGTRELALALDKDASAQVTDAMGNARAVASAGGVLKVEVCSSPVWLEGIKATQVKGVQAGGGTGVPPVRQARCLPHLLEDFDSAWAAIAEPDKGFEENNFDLPRFKGEMTASLVPSFDGGKAFHIVLQRPAKERKLAPWYAAFVPPRPIPLPGRPTKLGLYVHGNSGWGRVIPQLTDAKGEVWTFVGPKDEWNSDDIRSQSSVSFDGWKFIEMELPSNLPNGWPGPALAFWKNERGDRIVDYPLRLTKLFIEQRTHVYYVNEILPVPEPAITLDKILCTYDDPYAAWHLSKGW